MSAHQVLVLVIIQLAILLLPAYGLAKLFDKAGVPGWKALIPFYNTRVMLQLGQRPMHWLFWQVIPIVGWFVSMGIFAEIDSNDNVYPYWPGVKWSQDNYGPVYVPAKGAVITLTPENYALYERAIRVYEGNDFYTRDGKYFLNGQEVAHYTFRMDYYWMMGDSRHGSQDSRYWGFVPEDHIVGKPELIWLSWDRGVRWGRIFKRIH
jgi:hypothetical protein